MDRRILVVHEDVTVGGQLARLVARPDREVKLTQDGTSALELFVEGQFALGLIACRLPDISGAELVREVNERRLPVVLLLVCDPSESSQVERALSYGAYDCFYMPIDPGRLDHLVDQALADSALRIEVDALEQQFSHRSDAGEFVAEGARMREILSTAARLKKERHAWISGEVGTGKSRFARHLHHVIWQSSGPLLTLECGYWPESITERELGSEGRSSQRTTSVFDRLHGGTLVLNEVEKLSSHAQSLLKARLAEWSANYAESRNEHVVALSGIDYQQVADRALLRPELLEAFQHTPLDLPPLREREPVDWVNLVRVIFTALHERGYALHSLAPDAFACLMQYQWPGNLRELEDVLEQLVATTSDAIITPDDLPQELAHVRDEGLLLHFELDRRLGEITSALRERVERLYLRRVLAARQGKIGPTAEQCGISRRALSDKLRRLGIEKKIYRLARPLRRRR
jgi:DNA-binding NtrC family response regulator